MMRVAVIGKGNVGRALAPNIATAGHNVAFVFATLAIQNTRAKTAFRSIRLARRFPCRHRHPGPQLIAHSSNAVVCYWHVADIGLCAHFCL